MLQVGIDKGGYRRDIYPRGRIRTVIGVLFVHGIHDLIVVVVLDAFFGQDGIIGPIFDGGFVGGMHEGGGSASGRNDDDNDDE